jgi:type IX secretion system PorP/SprF family membrane protein
MARSILKGVLFAGALLLFGQIKAQDVHFSQYASSPLMLNPALAGLDNGDYRVYVNFRNQWPTVAAGNTYRTYAGGADMAIGNVTKYNSYAGIGISFMSDQAGDIHLNTNTIQLTAAYHIMLNKSGSQQLSAGIQGSFNMKSIDASLATFDSQYDPSTGIVNPNGPRETFGRTRVIYPSAGLGLLYVGTFKRGLTFYFGFALDHVNQPDISFEPSGQDANGLGAEKLYMKETFHGGFEIPVGTRLTVIPNFLELLQGPSNEFDLGADFKTALGNDARTSTSAIHFGVQYRGVLDAIVASARIDVKGFSCGLSYDINVSKLLPASHTIGAPEISLMYTVTTKKKPRPGHCPVAF